LLQLDRIRAHAAETLYENFLSPATRREVLERFAIAETLCYFALGLFEVFICARNSTHRHLLHEPLTVLMKARRDRHILEFQIARRGT
jgi:hypothetical protein